MIKVLICEDDAITREYLVAVLQMEPEIAAVYEIADGSLAEERVRDLRPHVVLMDLRMPVMDGIQATRIISRRYPEVDVIMLSGETSENSVRDCLMAGAAGYVSKNAGPDELISIIKRVHRGEHIGRPALSSDIPHTALGNVGPALA